MESLERSREDYEDYAVQVERIFEERIARARAEADRKAREESKRWQDGAVRGLNDYAGEAEDAVTNAMQGMENALASFVTRGKADFKKSRHRRTISRCESDVVVLMCLHPAKFGGSSRFTSTVKVYNEMLKRRPELVAELAGPIYRDHRGEIPEGKDPWWQLPIFNFHEDYLTVSAGGSYIRSAQRFEQLPCHSEALKEALALFAGLCDELSYDMEFLQGDVQILHNHVTAHSRTEFEDYSEPERRRNLLRLWLGTPGGRPLPPAFRDRFAHLKDGERPAGGVVVPGTEYRAPLYPE